MVPCGLRTASRVETINERLISCCDWTEAQQRGALHAHILVWFRKRKPRPNWQALPPNPRTVRGHGPKQQSLSSSPAQMRPPQQQPQQLQHDSCYQLSEMGRVSAEMVRPTVAPGDFGGYDVEMLRVAALARTMLIRLKYLHICSPDYCLKERELFHRLLARLALRALRAPSALVSTRGC